MNKIFFIGRIANDLEIKKNQNGKSVCTFDIAVKRGFDNKDTDFFECVIWNSGAENLVKYQRKGAQIAIDGAARVDKFKDKEGKNRQKVYILVNNVEFLNPKQEQAANNESIDPKIADLADDLPF